jgi:hypothetical protein
VLVLQIGCLDQSLGEANSLRPAACRIQRDRAICLGGPARSQWPSALLVRIARHCSAFSGYLPGKGMTQRALITLAPCLIQI